MGRSGLPLLSIRGQNSFPISEASALHSGLSSDGVEPTRNVWNPLPHSRQLLTGCNHIYMEPSRRHRDERLLEELDTAASLCWP